MKIITHGLVTPPETLLAHAEIIKHDNYKTNTPVRFQKHADMSEDGELFKRQLSKAVGVAVEKLDWVFFSVCQGATPHVDKLDESKFTDTTFVIPIILPSGSSKITAEEEVVVVELNRVYEFDHTKVHSMTLEDIESGCVVVMAAVIKDSFIALGEECD